LVFSAGAEALDQEPDQRQLLAEKLIVQLRMIAKGSHLIDKGITHKID
jgi:hypothetical protein